MLGSYKNLIMILQKRDVQINKFICQEEGVRPRAGIFSVSPRPAGHKHVMSAPGRPRPRVSRKGIDSGDKIGAESFCVCDSLDMWPLGSSHLRLPKSLFL